MSERLTRKQLKEDHFIDLVQRVVSYARENPIVVGVAAIVFVGAVAAAVRIGGQAAGVGEGADNPAAARALSDARQAFMGGDLNAGATALENVRQEFKRTEEGREATYVLANTYLEMGDYAKAEEAFRSFLAKPLFGDLLTDGAHSGIAACLEEKGDLDGAYREYDALWLKATTPAGRIAAAFSAARVAKALGRPADARAHYQAVLDEFPDAPEADRARFELLEEDAAAAS